MATTYSISDLAREFDLTTRAMNLVHEGKIRSEETVEGGLRKRKLFPSYASLPVEAARERPSMRP